MINFDALSLPTLFILATTTLVLLVSRDWRVILSVLMLQYTGVFVLVGVSWPVEMALIKFLTGIISVVILGMELIRIPVEPPHSYGVLEDEIPFSTKAFRIFLAIMIVLVAYSLAPEMAKWLLSSAYYQILGSVLLIGMGILILGTAEHSFRVVVGLFTFLSGFEIIFASLDTTALVAGYFSVLTFGIAMLGVYFISSLKIIDQP